MKRNKLTFALSIFYSFSLIGCNGNTIKPIPSMTKDEEKIALSHIASIADSYVQPVAGTKKQTITKQEAEEEIATREIEKIEIPLASGLNPDEYEQTYKLVTSTYTTEDLIYFGLMDNQWYPGSVMKIKEDFAHKSELQMVNLKRASAKLSINLETVQGIDPTKLVATVEDPSALSEVRLTVNKLVEQTNNSKKATLAEIISCQLIELDKASDIDTKIGANPAYSGGSVLSRLGDFGKKDTITKAALVFKRQYYAIDMDRPYNGVAGVFSSEVTGEEVKNEFPSGYLPVYTSVVYGKISIISIETNLPFETLRGQYTSSFSSNTAIAAAMRQSFIDSGTSMNYFTYGGATEQTGQITESSITDVARDIASTELVSAKPIGYRFYYFTGGIAATATVNQHIEVSYTKRS